MNQAIMLHLIRFLGIDVIQSFMFILSLYAFGKKKIVLKPFIISSLIFAVACSVFRILPIQFGIPTLLTLLVMIGLAVWLNDVPIYQAIKYSLTCVFILLITEVVDILTLKLIFDATTYNNIMNNEFKNTLAGIPANFLFAMIILFIYVVRVCKHSEKKISDKTGDNQ